MMETSRPKRVRRRKACDLCYHKKIKCDAKEPRCSGCKLYNSECTYTGPTRATAVKSNQAKKIEMLEARLAQLEAQKQPSPKAPNPEFLLTSSVPDSAASISEEEQHLWATNTDSTLNESPGSSTNPGSSISGRESSKTLPPLRRILPSIEDYFQNSNQVLPLFERESFVKMLRSWYAYPAHRKSDVWAAINVVLALAHRHSYASSYEETQNMQRYIDNVQSVLNKLVINEPCMLVLQTLLGLVLVFHGSADQGPASILIASAIRLCQSLRLHTKSTAQEFEPAEALQRSRVFWIAFILDRDLAMRLTQPPMHQESEIDIEIPSLHPPDDVGIIMGFSGQKFNYFRSTVQLAYIQGKLYHMCFSVRALKLPDQQKSQNMLRIREMLENWQKSIPIEFQPELAAATVAAEYLRYICLLHYTHLQLIATTHYADSHHLEWLQGLLSCNKGSTPAARSDLAARLPNCWDKLVTEARTCMHLYAATPENDSALTWLVSCGYLTSIMFITVNNLACPDSPCRLTDQSNVESALLLLERLIKATDDGRLKRIHSACKDINERARLTVLSSSSDEFSDFNPPGLEFGDEDPLDDGRWGLVDNNFWTMNEYASS
ncbi:fungal specific transcription factor [Colletotrichum costaricense]|uniref:Fungal specific transcription factor n=1 Tax=Colletotrichum costaricense TaxID=1209916 RepID=A0AAI9YNJ0_9PEZI|nr:fungal specific transcription factor [Colletotrichum costaricense]KAK1517828.1 fungal specific transcription factor [Colletotrichum costaricense]